MQLKNDLFDRNVKNFISNKFEHTEIREIG